MSAPIENVFVREFSLADGHILKISQLEVGDVGCVVWDAAIVLAKYLERHSLSGKASFQGRRCLELGAGTGLVGLVASSMGADVLITDLEDFVPLMNMNIATNKEQLHGRITATCLKWKQDISRIPTELDYIFVADCIYYEEAIAPLVETLTAACQKTSVILLSYEKRLTGNKPELEKMFFQLMTKDFCMKVIPAEEQDPVYRSDDITIVQFTKR